MPKSMRKVSFSGSIQAKATRGAGSEAGAVVTAEEARLGCDEEGGEGEEFDVDTVGGGEGVDGGIGGGRAVGAVEAGTGGDVGGVGGAGIEGLVLDFGDGAGKVARKFRFRYAIKGGRGFSFGAGSWRSGRRMGGWRPMRTRKKRIRVQGTENGTGSRTKLNRPGFSARSSSSLCRVSASTAPLMRHSMRAPGNFSMMLRSFAIWRR